MNSKKTINTQDNQEMDNYCDGDDDDDTDDDDHDEQLRYV